MAFPRFAHTGDPVSQILASEQQLHLRGQRRINLIWETTQALVALTIVVSNIAAAFHPVPSVEDGAWLRNAAFLIIGFYFGRTNHARIGDGRRFNDEIS